MRRAPLWHSERAPIFLSICWEEIQEDGGVITVEAHLCRDHRGEIALKHPTARGCGRLGGACDFCESRQPRRSPGMTEQWIDKGSPS
jgi:hypothetical protein